MSDRELSTDERKFIDDFVKELSDAGYDLKTQLSIFRESKRQYEAFLQRQEKQKLKK